MCHLILLMPVIALPIFWLAPLNFAVPIYVVIVLMAAFLYWLITKAMREPIQDGFQSLIDTEAEVVSKSGTGRSARYLIRARGEGELWSAYSRDSLLPRELVKIVAVKGIGVVVERAEPGSRLGETGNGRIIASGATDNRRYCH